MTKEEKLRSIIGDKLSGMIIGLSPIIWHELQVSREGGIVLYGEWCYRIIDDEMIAFCVEIKGNEIAVISKDLDDRPEISSIFKESMVKLIDEILK